MKTGTHEPTVFLIALVATLTGLAQQIETTACQLDVHGLFTAVVSLAHWLVQWLV